MSLFRTSLVDNGDCTITAIPIMDDVNGKTISATMTINVNKRSFYIGRQNLLEAA